MKKTSFFVAVFIVSVATVFAQDVIEVGRLAGQVEALKPILEQAEKEKDFLDKLTYDSVCDLYTFTYNRWKIANLMYQIDIQSLGLRDTKGLKGDYLKGVQNQNKETKARITEMRKQIVAAKAENDRILQRGRLKKENKKLDEYIASASAIGR